MDLHKAVRDPWVWGQFVLIALVGVLAARFHPSTPDPLVQLAGAFVLGVGLFTILAAMTFLGPNLTPGTEPLPHGTLITRGPYAFVRHPIYTGVVLLLTGYTMAWGSLPAGMLVLAVSLGYFEGKARAEERWLVKKQPEYAAYMTRVPRIVPFGWK
ncbi:MAG: isoprenylcysteine carboxylmethyltransferase family protein [Gemmatimonadales bacterium]